MSAKLNAYDVIIIGSGLGSLSCASFITQMYKLRVLVVEQHSRPGGLSQEILTDNDVTLEIGIHQVGELGADSMFTKLMSYISNGQSSWRKLPDTFIKFHFPDFIYEVTAGEDNQIARLSELFPAEEVNIHQYYKDIDLVTKWFRGFTTASLANDKSILLKLLDLAPGKVAMMTTEAYLDYRFSNDKLKSLIASHWTDYGLPPKLSAFLKHAILVNNHKEGVYYPNSGSTQLINSIVSTIQDHGGDFIFDAQVKEIKYQGNIAKAITILNKNSGEETILSAGIIISGIGLFNTYTRLLDEKLVAEKLKALHEFRNQGVSFIKLFATLKSNPESVGADASLSWVYPGYNHNQNFSDKNKFTDECISQFSISFPSLKKENTAVHSMKINTLVDYDAFLQLVLKEGNDGDYDRLKHEIGNNLLNAAEKLYPGLLNLIESWDLYTPVSAKRDTQHHNGNIFGMPDTPERYKNLDFNCFTPLENVYITGSDITSSGIYGAILSGALTASAVFKDKQFFLKVIQKVSHKNIA